MARSQIRQRIGAVRGGRQQLQLLLIMTARFMANCAAVAAGPERRLGHQAAQAPTAEELAQWRSLWTLLSTWYGRPSNEIFVPVSLAKDKTGRL